MTYRLITQDAIDALKSNWNAVFSPEMMAYKDSYTIPTAEFIIKEASSKDEASQLYWTLYN